jgi:hypothetical protein
MAAKKEEQPIEPDMKALAKVLKVPKAEQPKQEEQPQGKKA